MSGKFFGTDGVRGVANVFPMVSDFAMKLAMACGQKICVQKKRVAIAKDTRISGDMLEASLSAGFMAMGIDVVQLGVIPTPAVTMLTPQLGVDMAVMITASHNPYQDNGIKLIAANGDKFDDVLTDEIEKLIIENNFVFQPEEMGRVSINNQAIELYVDKVKQLGATSKPLQGMKIVFDCANGVFAGLATQIVQSFGAEVVTIGNSPNGCNINKNCGSNAVELMQRTVVEEKADLGIAVDGDGDRIIICDENGNKVDGDQIIAFIGGYLHSLGQLKADTVVATVWSNLGLEKYLNSQGIRFQRVAVGERYVIQKMQELGSNFGGEESGHMVLSDLGPSGDGLTAGLTICLGLQKLGKKMSEIFPIFAKCPCEMKNIRLQNPEMVSQVLAEPKVKAAISQATAEMEACGGSVIIRRSGTEPMIKVRVEATQSEPVMKAAKMIVDEIVKFL